MTLRRCVLWAGSAVVTVLLIVVLIKISKLDLRLTVLQLRSVSWLSFAELVVLTAVHVFLSTQKWRCVDAALRRSTDSAPSRTMSFALTSIGVALGQVLPVQVSMSAARTLGTYLHGRALRRGTGGTLFEQSFDLLIVGFLAIASLATKIYRGGGTMWAICAVAMTLFSMIAIGPAVGIIHRQAISLNAATIAPRNRVLRAFGSLEHSGLLNPGLARQLMALSIARFAVQAMMAAETAEAIGVRIPLWHLAAAMPFVIIACVIVVTPGGLGVNELSYTTTLRMFGTPLNVGAQWALSNRVLVASSCFVVAACATAVLGLTKLMATGRQAKAMQEDPPW